ncbi:transposable element Tc1 transposase [Trichonephila clavipes]|nr:transposable element Tc1 transposase [Trichonephila clavipes]
MPAQASSTPLRLKITLSVAKRPRVPEQSAMLIFSHSQLKRPTVDLIWKLGEGSAAQVTSSSLDIGSKLRGPSPIALVQLYKVDRSECAVRNCWEQWTREGTHARKTESGVTGKTTKREDRRIVQQALVDPTVTRLTIRAEVGVAIVPQTNSRHLAEANLKSKRPFRALPETPEHRQLRLQWCQARSMWNVTDWQKVVFSDESRFVLGTNDHRVRVWRRPGAIFQQDNARPQTARVAQVFLRHFQTLPWPARSPDLSPVEHVWDQLKRQTPSCHSAHDLELAVEDLWAHLPHDNLRCLINSMSDRVAACIVAGGGLTRY